MIQKLLQTISFLQPATQQLKRLDPAEIWVCLTITTLWVEVHAQTIFEDLYSASPALRATAFLAGWVRLMLAGATSVALNSIYNVDLDHNVPLFQDIGALSQERLNFGRIAVTAISLFLLRRILAQGNIFILFPGLSKFMETLLSTVASLEPVAYNCPADGLQSPHATTPSPHRRDIEDNIVHHNRQHVPLSMSSSSLGTPARVESPQATKLLESPKRREGSAGSCTDSLRNSKRQGEDSLSKESTRSTATTSATNSTWSSRSSVPDSLTPQEYELLVGFIGKAEARLIRTGKWVSIARAHLQLRIAEAEDALRATGSNNTEKRKAPQVAPATRKENTQKTIKTSTRNPPVSPTSKSFSNTQALVQNAQPDDQTHSFQLVPPLDYLRTKPSTEQADVIMNPVCIPLASSKGKEREAGWAIPSANTGMPVGMMEYEPTFNGMESSAELPSFSMPAVFAPAFSITWNVQAAVTAGDYDMADSFDIPTEPSYEPVISTEVEMQSHTPTVLSNEEPEASEELDDEEMEPEGDEEQEEQEPEKGESDYRPTLYRVSEPVSLTPPVPTPMPPVPPLCLSPSTTAISARPMISLARLKRSVPATNPSSTVNLPPVNHTTASTAAPAILTSIQPITAAPQQPQASTSSAAPARMFRPLTSSSAIGRRSGLIARELPKPAERSLFGSQTAISEADANKNEKMMLK